MPGQPYPGMPSQPMPGQPYPGMPSQGQGQNAALAAGAGALASTFMGKGHKGHDSGKNAALAAGAVALAGTVLGTKKGQTHQRVIQSSHFLSHLGNSGGGGHGGSSGGSMASLASTGLAAYLTDKQKKKAAMHAGKQGLKPINSVPSTSRKMTSSAIISTRRCLTMRIASCPVPHTWLRKMW